tara:strand:+ start:423 stop:2186 length:1764 start_codon:yes stop_codon:yes gene_type:complete
MSVQASKVFPKSSRTDRQRASTDRDFAGNSKEESTSKAFIGLSKNLFAIHKNLGAIADLLKQQSSNEKKEDDAELKKQQKDEDARQKSGAEKALEGIISTAVLKPIQKMKDTTAGIFERLIKVLGALGIGTIAVKGLKGIEAWMEGDKSILEQLEKDIKTMLGVAAGIFVAVNVGIPLISGALGSIIGSLGVGGAFSGILALLGNPYVWLGIIAAVALTYTGTMLYKLLRGEYGANLEGIGSYNEATQESIMRISEIGIEEWQKEQRLKMQKFLVENPQLLNKDGTLNRAKLNFSFAGAEYLEMEDDLKKSMKGEFDKFDPSRMKAEDAEIMQKIPELIEKFRGEWAKFFGLAREITALYEGKTSLDELPENVQNTIKGLMSTQAGHKAKMIEYLDGIKELREQMTSDGKNQLQLFLIKNNIPDLLFRADWWGELVKPGPILSLDQMTAGMEGLRPGKAIDYFNSLGNFNTNLKSELQKFDPNMTFQSETKDNSLSQNNDNSNLDFASTSNAFTNENLSLANQISDYDAFNEKFNIVPFDISQDNTNFDSDITSTSFFAETDLPAFSIFDNDNFYRDLAQSNYGVYD